MQRIKTTMLFSILILLIIIQAGLIFCYQSSFKDASKGLHLSTAQKNNIAPSNMPTHYSYFSKKEFFDEAYEQAIGQIKSADSKIYGGIIPHHLIVKDKIAAFFEGIKQNNYETIILIGPNHFRQGKSDIILSQAQWKTPYGIIEPDLNLIEKLKQIAGINIEEEPFIAEHSISGLVGFIKKSFPDSQIVPIILKNKTSSEKSTQLAKAIYENVDPEKILVLSSVDFSHYQPTAVANFHDQKSNSVISNFDFDKIYNLEIDSPSSIYVLLKYLEKIKAKNSELIFSTNSGTLIQKTDEPTTSHNFFYFKKHEVKKESLINFLFFGDLMLDRNVGQKIKQHGLDYFFSKLAGEENRFFQGIDIISANLEGATTNNGAHYNPKMAYDFAFNPEIIKALKKYHFNFFNLANNHFSDQGEKGITETTQNLDKLKLNYSGCRDGMIDEKCASKIIEIDNRKIGLIGLSMVYSELDKKKLDDIFKKIKNKTDLIIVNIHWGTEYSHKFSKTQQEIAYQLIDAGADIVIGHHPHVVQGMEIYRNKPIFYSLGNFIFDQYFSKDTQEGLAVGVNVIQSKEQNKLEFYLFPFKSIASQVKLMDNKEKNKFLENFINWSNIDEKIIEQIKSNKIEFNY
ncbi:AmmeMemoRadiSam system protein B [Candidatus Kuenenbacteria bacterium HGW-Kuenenbacteria-1]|uniref:AmmeMemoRadiSam system protein B n=1 Tax=Candidatus Kuenenbacteria bacterium HGW-Kuenenbacteria-1 TaxID=2013812 RepID=A0A2N1UPA1_9BACT|nr:MAG: AmmeMemoRadiSam system protein B [Candidatus Kuenenbacteria bacterium HGW-Kuenenbacteria-1]